MTADTRHDRTVRLLAARLEVIARAGERPGSREPDLEPQVLRAAAATRNAVFLELISDEEAGRLWADIAARHPRARWARNGPATVA